ncbi:MAG: hypothetical protein WCV99_03995 [Sterolibacterium sp.]|jgi:hypothetical protein
MNHRRNFVASLVGVVAGTFLMTMTAAFLTIPYSMSAHPGEASSRATSDAYHPS